MAWFADLNYTGGAAYTSVSKWYVVAVSSFPVIRRHRHDVANSVTRPRHIADADSNSMTGDRSIRRSTTSSCSNERAIAEPRAGLRPPWECRLATYRLPAELITGSRASCSIWWRRTTDRMPIVGQRFSADRKQNRWKERIREWQRPRTKRSAELRKTTSFSVGSAWYCEYSNLRTKSKITRERERESARVSGAREDDKLWYHLAVYSVPSTSATFAQRPLLCALRVDNAPLRDVDQSFVYTNKTLTRSQQCIVNYLLLSCLLIRFSWLSQNYNAHTKTGLL